MKDCVICGRSEFVDSEVLWPELIEAWELSEQEVVQINRQQGTHCLKCGNSLRSQALAMAIMEAVGHQGLFERFVRSWSAGKLKVLSINTCGTLHGALQKMKGLELAEYPDYDMTKLSMADNHYDLVLHSDTLEHVADPLQGLRECHRVLKQGGHCIYTIPIVAGRMSRSTEGRPPSFHGDPKQKGADWKVHTEYGADAWMQPLEAGFRSCAIHAFEAPAALALSCKK